MRDRTSLFTKLTNAKDYKSLLTLWGFNTIEDLISYVAQRRSYPGERFGQCALSFSYSVTGDGRTFRVMTGGCDTNTTCSACILYAANLTIEEYALRVRRLLYPHAYRLKLKKF